MESTRQLKIARQIQKDLSEIFRARGMAAYGGAMITVSEVRISPDLAVAKVFLSIFPSDKTKFVFDKVENETRQVRAELGQRVRHQLRIVPELHFHVDDTLDKLEHIDNLIKNEKLKMKNDLPDTGRIKNEE